MTDKPKRPERTKPVGPTLDRLTIDAPEVTPKHHTDLNLVSHDELQALARDQSIRDPKLLRAILLECRSRGMIV